MGIEKFIRVENVGRFTKLAASGDVQLRKLTLIFGPNGHGKTTLAGLLRSLATGDPAFVNERATLGATATPTAEVLVSSKKLTFKDGKWDGTCPELEIFDSTFVSDNVYTGEHVDSEHRKNLYNVVVGAAAVALAKRVDDLDSEGRSVAQEISRLEEQVTAYVQTPFKLEDFLALVPEAEVADRLRELTAKLSAVRKSKEVLARRELESVSPPQVPIRAFDVLKQSVEQLSEVARDRVRDHIKNHLDASGEQWLRRGLDYAKDGLCPFCAQSLEGVDLVRLFSDYFSTAYQEHTVEVERAANELEQRLGEQVLSALQKRALENDARIGTWADLVDLSHAKCSVDRLEGPWRHLRTLLEEALRQKRANPSVALAGDSQLEAALRDFQEAAASFSDVNASIARANEQIAVVKKQAASTEEETIERELRRLRNMQIRERPEVVDLCDRLRESRKTKEAKETEKRDVKKQLDELAGEVLTRYEGAINTLLRNFGATFTMTGTKPAFPGGKASSTYQIAINNKPLSLGDSKTPRGTPCFRTALSSGDKSTLALAFFVARLQQDTDVANKVVVFDDPLSSLDGFRSLCTQQEVRKIADRAKQTIVLSHDHTFLQGIHDRARGATTHALEVVRSGDGIALRPWDIESYCRGAVHQDYFALRNYIDSGDPNDETMLRTVRSVRPYLEGVLRHLYPEDFPSGEWLGWFIGRVRDAAIGTRLERVKNAIAELEALNEFASPYMHSDPQKPLPPLVDTTLRSFASRALAFVQGGP